MYLNVNDRERINLDRFEYNIFATHERNIVFSMLFSISYRTSYSA